MPRLYGLMIARDEADVVEQSLTYALNHCEKIICLDNNSTDGTWEIMQRMAQRHPGRVIAHARLTEPFRDSLRAIAYNAFHKELSANDWWLRLDADEFLIEHPAKLLDTAQTEEADFIRGYQMTFMLTDKDVAAIDRGEDSRNRPIQERRRYYRVDWREFRFFRNDPSQAWDIHLNPQFPQNLSKGRVCSKGIFNRHYQYLDIEQISKRLSARKGNSAFSHVVDTDWRKAVMPAAQCHFHNEGAAVKYSPIADFWWKRFKLEFGQRIGRLAKPIER